MTENYGELQWCMKCLYIGFAVLKNEKYITTKRGTNKKRQQKKNTLG